MDVCNYKLKYLGAVDDDRCVPWIVSLPDLMVVCDLLDGAHFVNYVLHRLRLELHGRVFVPDEVHLVGHYIQTGLFVDGCFVGDGAVDHVSILDSTDDLYEWYAYLAGETSRVFPKPSQALPKLKQIW